MKVENHDTTKLGNQHEHLLKGNTKNVNKYQTLFCNNVRVIVLVFPHYSTVIVCMLCVFTNYKIIENIDFCSWRT
jgi:hypothetical protein